MGIKISMEFLIGLIITLIVFALLGGCINKFLNPKCDLRAVDAFDNLTTLYTNCMDKNANGVCKCGEFDINSLPPDYKISLTPFIKDNKESIRVSLVCNEMNAKNSYLRKDENEMVRIYVADPESFKEVKDLNGQYISEQILNDGFEIVGKEVDVEYELNYVKNVNNIFGFYDSLVLVNYNGKVAFLARILNQEGYLESKTFKKTFQDC